MVVGDFGSIDPHMERIGLMLILGSVMTICTSRITAAINKTNREADAAFEAGFEMGMDKGYLEGRKAGRPTAVTNIFDRRSG
jgi:hypothetical protein